MSSGVAFFWISWRIEIAVSMSTVWLLCTRETFELGKLESLEVEFAFFLKNDSEFVREESRLRTPSSSKLFSSSNDARGSKSVCTGESNCDLICCRSCALRLAGESTLRSFSRSADGELLFVLGFASLWCNSPWLCAFPIVCNAAERCWSSSKALGSSKGRHWTRAGQVYSWMRCCTKAGKLLSTHSPEIMP